MRAEEYRGKIAAMPLKKRLGLSFLLGSAMVLALPPLGFFPLLFICIPLAMTITAQSKSAAQAFLAAWLFGYGFFMTGLHWFGIAFQTFFGSIPWFMPFTVIVIPAYIALYYGAAGGIAWFFRKGKSYPLVFSVLLFWAEYLRSHYVTDFPWNALGHAWHYVLPILQIASVGGIYGLTLLTLLWAAAPLAPKKTAAALCLSFFFAFGWGTVWLASHPSALSTQRIRIIQPNITQEEKSDFARHENNFKKHIALTSLPSTVPLAYTVWPETAFDLTPKNRKEKLLEISRALQGGSIGLVGANRFTAEENGVGIHNSLLAIGEGGIALATHDKFRLAPWGEYILFRDIFGATPLYQNLEMNDVIPGPGPSTLSPAGRPSFSPIICFESAYAGRMRNKAQKRPEFLLFVTNDAWSMAPAPFPSLGPHQHFGMGRLRAIEEGLPIIRAANTGISAVIDPQGRILARIGLGSEGILEHTLPLAASPTFYSRTGDGWLLPLAGLMTLALFYGGMRRKSI